MPESTPGHERHTLAMLTDYFGSAKAAIEFMLPLAGQVIVIPSVEAVERLATELQAVDALTRDPTRQNRQRVASLCGMPVKAISARFLHWSGRTVTSARNAAAPPELGGQPTNGDAAAKLLGLTRTDFRRRVARGELPAGIQFDGQPHWNRLEIQAIADAERDQVAEWVDPAESRSGGLESRDTLCWETGQTFTSRCAAARWAGTDTAAIQRAVRTGKESMGFHWVDAETPEGQRPPLQEYRTWVECVETGEAFTKLADAIEWVRRRGDKRSVPRLSVALRKGEMVGGVTFRIVSMERRREVWRRIIGMKQTGRPEMPARRRTKL